MTALLRWPSRNRRRGRTVVDRKRREARRLEMKPREGEARPRWRRKGALPIDDWEPTVPGAVSWSRCHAVAVPDRRDRRIERRAEHLRCAW